MKPVLPASHSLHQRRLRLGLLVNPVAGMGGPLGQKGSDHLQASPGERAAARAVQALSLLAGRADMLELVTLGGGMGEQAAVAAGFQPQVVYNPQSPSEVKDTMEGARALVVAGVDLLLFAGGDGTARDLCQAIGQIVPVLGIPAGVKMHSGVFAVNPRGVAAIVELLLSGELVTVDEGEVRDLDEQALREGRVSTRHYGELRVPAEGRYLQQVKCSGREVEELAAQEIAAEVVENLRPGVIYFIGPGSTTAAIMTALHLPKTLMGFDAVRDGKLVKADIAAADIETLLDGGPGRAIITATPSQGLLLGRGNQQLTPAILRRIGRSGIDVVATHAKLKDLEGRPLLVDTGDPELDDSLSGWIEVITGYSHRVLYRVATHA